MPTALQKAATSPVSISNEQAHLALYKPSDIGSRDRPTLPSHLSPSRGSRLEFALRCRPVSPDCSRQAVVAVRLPQPNLVCLARARARSNYVLRRHPQTAPITSKRKCSPFDRLAKG